MTMKITPGFYELNPGELQSSLVRQFFPRATSLNTVCACLSRKDSGYLCTRPCRHVGPHVAHTACGSPLALWTHDASLDPDLEAAIRARLTRDELVTAAEYLGGKWKYADPASCEAMRDVILDAIRHAIRDCEGTLMKRGLKVASGGAQ